MLLAIAVSWIMYVTLPPLLDGVERKIKADVQSRIGPPSVLQTFYDILKLLSKETVFYAKPVFPALSLSLITTMVFTLSLIITKLTLLHPSTTGGGVNGLNGLYVSYLLSIALVLLMSIHAVKAILYTVSLNPFSILGAFRKLSIDILNEAVFVAFAIAMYMAVIGVAPRNIVYTVTTLIPILVSTYVYSRRLPYDLHEAEPELASGSIIELSGPLLGLYIYSSLVERYVLTSIPLALLMLLIGVSTNPFLRVLLLHLSTTLIYVFYGVLSFTIGRSRVDLAFKTLALIYSILISIWICIYAFIRTYSA